MKRTMLVLLLVLIYHFARGQNFLDTFNNCLAQWQVQVKINPDYYLNDWVDGSGYSHISCSSNQVTIYSYVFQAAQFWKIHTKLTANYSFKAGHKYVIRFEGGSSSSSNGWSIYPRGGGSTTQSESSFIYLPTQDVSTLSIAYEPTSMSGAFSLGNISIIEDPCQGTNASISGNSTYCYSTPLTLTATSGKAHEWITTAGSWSGTATIQVYQGYGSTVGVYVLDNSYCLQYASKVMGASPPIPVISPAGPIGLCPGQSVTLTSSSGPNYHWGNGYSALGTSQSLTVSAAGTYRVRNDYPGCSLWSSNQVVVTQNAAPSVTISGQTQVCPGGNTTLSCTSGYLSYEWTVQGSSQVLSTSSSYTVTTPATYSVKATNQYGCSTTQSATVTNGKPATPTIAVSQLCGHTLLQSSSATTYTWKLGSATISTASSIDVTTAGTYTLTITNSAGCVSDQASASITIHPAATEGIIYVIGDFCSQGSVQLMAGEGSSWDWGVINGTQYTSRTIPVYLPGTYEVHYTDNYNCPVTSQAEIGGCGCTNCPRVASDEDPNYNESKLIQVSTPTVFPNPAQNEITVAIPEVASAPVPLRILDSFGNTRGTSDIPPGTNHRVINIQSLETGLYIVEIRLEKKTRIRKVMVVRE